MPIFEKPDKVVEWAGPLSPEGFEVLNVLEIIWTELRAEDIPCGGKAEYH